jgi:hypothetical protein
MEDKKVLKYILLQLADTGTQKQRKRKRNLFL